MAHDAAVADGLRPPLALPQHRDAVRAFVEREGLVVGIGALCVALLALVMPSMFVADSWLALVDGRVVARHGLPHVDTLGAWTLGKRWVDQQWGAQLLLYVVARAAGLRAVALVSVASVGAALAVAGVAARRLGGTARSAGLPLLLALLAAPWMAQVRTQTLALPLFVALYALLAADSRAPSRRVLLVLPLLAVWANLHGSAALAAGLVALHGLTLVRRRATRARGCALLAAPLALGASPYGPATLAGYYRTMLFDPPFAHVVSEWQPMGVGALTAIFLVAACAYAALWSAHRSALTPFERWATVLLLFAALQAIRNATWFALALAVALPRLVDAARPAAAPTRRVRRSNVVVAAVAVAAAALLLVVAFTRPTGAFDRGGSPSEAAAIAAAAGRAGVVLADDEHADWLLWERPELAGRVAYDARFELLDRAQLAQVVALDRVRPAAWRTCGATARVVTFGSARGGRLLRSLLPRGARLLFAANGLGAYVQRPRAGGCAR
jgi:hypothetical protein